MKKKKETPWIPTSSGPMRFIKILNIEWRDQERGDTIYDVNVLEEITTGEILLYIYSKGKTVPIGVRLLDKNIGISHLNHVIRDSFKAWEGLKMRVFKIDQAGFIDVDFPKLIEGHEVNLRPNQEKEKIKPARKDERVTHTNDTAVPPVKKKAHKPKPDQIKEAVKAVVDDRKEKEESKPKRTRKPKVEKEVEQSKPKRTRKTKEKPVESKPSRKKAVKKETVKEPKKRKNKSTKKQLF